MKLRYLLLGVLAFTVLSTTAQLRWGVEAGVNVSHALSVARQGSVSIWVRQGNMLLPITGLPMRRSNCRRSLAVTAHGWVATTMTRPIVPPNIMWSATILHII